MCRNVAKQKLTEKLRHMRDYEAFPITDEEMGITVDAIGSGILMIDPYERALHRFKFHAAIKNGLQGIHINIFGELCQGMNNPSSIFVWKCPAIYGSEHMGHVQSIIQVCRDMAPKYMSTELAKRLNSIISQIFCVPSRVRKVLWNHLFLGNTNPKGDMANEYC